MTSVLVTRPRHPLQGRTLDVLGQMRRHGRVELLLVLPDGSKSLIPAAWTDLGDDGNGPAEQVAALTLGSLADLLHADTLVSALRARGEDPGRRLHGSHRARRTSVQPAQLSLMPDQVPAPPPNLIVDLPQPQVTAAIKILAGLIAKVAVGVGTEVAGDE